MESEAFPQTDPSVSAAESNLDPLLDIAARRSSTGDLVLIMDFKFPQTLALANKGHRTRAASQQSAPIGAESQSAAQRANPQKSAPVKSGSSVRYQQAFDFGTLNPGGPGSRSSQATIISASHALDEAGVSTIQSVIIRGEFSQGRVEWRKALFDHLKQFFAKFQVNSLEVDVPFDRLQVMKDEFRQLKTQTKLNTQAKYGVIGSLGQLLPLSGDSSVRHWSVTDSGNLGDFKYHGTPNLDFGPLTRSSLLSLNLDRLQASQEFMTVFFKALPSSLEDLELSGSITSLSPIREVFDGLKSKTLKVFAASECLLGNLLIDSFFDFLKNTPTLEELELPKFESSSDSRAQITFALTSLGGMKKLQHLKIPYLLLSRDVSNLMGIVAQLPGLNSLDLFIDASGLGALTEALSKMPDKLKQGIRIKLEITGNTNDELVKEAQKDLTDLAQRGAIVIIK